MYIVRWSMLIGNCTCYGDGLIKFYFITSLYLKMGGSGFVQYFVSDAFSTQVVAQVRFTIYDGTMSNIVSIMILEPFSLK